MISRQKNWRMTVILLVLISNYSQAQIDYYIPENVYRFAEYLFHNRDYERAAGEFQRYGFLVSGGDLTDSLLFRIGMCHQLSENFSMALDYYQRIIGNSGQSMLVDQAHFQIANTYFAEGRYIESEHYIESTLPIVNSELAKLKMSQLLGMDYLRQHRWKKAENQFAFSTGKADGAQDSISLALQNFSHAGTQLRYKSPVLAGIFSGFLPGSGKFYTHNYTDGLYSFILIGIMAWQSYDGFNKNGKDSLKGWIYGGLGTVFYLGNIYGSLISAKLYNRQLEEHFLTSINLQINWQN